MYDLVTHKKYETNSYKLFFYTLLNAWSIGGAY